MRDGKGRRVVVTGLGMITPLGATVEKTWEGIVAGRSGIGPITRFDTTGLETTIAGEVRDFEPTDYMDRKEIRRADRFAQLAVAVAGQALKDASIEITPENAPRIGVAVGSGLGGGAAPRAQWLSHGEGPTEGAAVPLPIQALTTAAAAPS